MNSLFKIKSNIILLTIYAVILITFSLTDFTKANNVILYIICFITSFSVYLIIYFINKKFSIPLTQLVFISVFLRVLLMPVDQITSDDYYRYLWDGKMQVNGINPYHFAPNDSNLTYLHSDRLPNLVNHTHIKTIYPPASQMVFFLSYYLFGEHIWGLKIIYLLLDILIIIFLFKALEILEVKTSAVLLYAISPLVLCEFYINAHIDILLLLFICLSIYWLVKGNINFSMLFLGLSFMSKFYSLILLPLMLVYFYNEKKTLIFISKGLVFFIIPVIITLPYISHISNIFETIQSYSLYWYNNNPIYRIPYEWFVESAMLPDIYLRITIALLIIASLIFIITRETDIISKISYSIFAYFLFSPTVHPWYLTILCLFIVYKFRLLFVFWTGFISLTYFAVYNYHVTGIWKDISWLIYIEYIIIFVFLIYEYKLYKNCISGQCRIKT